MAQNIKRQFIQLSKAWYSKSAFTGDSKESFTIQLWSGDIFLGEFDINWYTLNKQLTPKLECWNDQWYILNEYFQDFIALLGSINGQNITPEDFGDKLEEIGIENATVTESPYATEEDNEKPHVFTMSMRNTNFCGEVLLKGWPFKPSEAAILDVIKKKTLLPEYPITENTLVDLEGIFSNGESTLDEKIYFYLKKIDPDN